MKILISVVFAILAIPFVLIGFMVGTMERCCKMGYDFAVWSWKIVEDKINRDLK